jgi:hypothetical protein
MQDNRSTLAPVQPEYLTRKQGAQILNISEAWLRKQDRLNKGPERVRFGKCVRYERHALLAFARALTEQ